MIWYRLFLNPSIRKHKIFYFNKLIEKSRERHPNPNWNSCTQNHTALAFFYLVAIDFNIFGYMCWMNKMLRSIRSFIVHKCVTLRKSPRNNDGFFAEQVLFKLNKTDRNVIDFLFLVAIRMCFCVYFWKISSKNFCEIEKFMCKMLFEFYENFMKSETDFANEIFMDQTHKCQNIWMF